MSRWFEILTGVCVLASPGAFADDGIPASLTGAKGDPERGRAIVANRQLGLCLLCHSGWTEGELRMRLVNPEKFNPGTIMPSYRRTEDLARVAPAFRGKPILTPQQIEDVVAYLATLK